MKTKHRKAARHKQHQREADYSAPDWLDKLAEDIKRREDAERQPMKQGVMA